MAKIGIVTITNNGSNYGNALQNYAVKRVYENLGHNAITIYSVDGAEYCTSMKYKLKMWIKAHSFLKSSLPFRRELAFTSFRKKYLNDSHPVTEQQIDAQIMDYDYFSVGSDQVWNFEFRCNSIHKDFLLLKFSPKEKRIAYSASFGISKLQINYIDVFEKALNGFKAISVRENEGKKIVESLIHKEASILIDPTLMLSREEWDEIKNNKINEKEKYVVVYFLGNMTEVLKKDLAELKEKGYKVHHFLNKEDPDLYSAGPREFISWISGASCVLTDSFHASVFSFIYNKPFYIYERCDHEESMMSRIETLLSTFQLKNRLRSEVEQINLNCDYSEAYEILKKEQVKTYQFLNNATQNKD